MKTLPLASISLDLDDLWAYLRTHGDPAWQDRPSYLPLVLPRLLDAFDEIDLRITFFIVGYDAAQAANRECLASITARGHEVGNHSFEHECWMGSSPRAELEADLTKAEDAIAIATGHRPNGFRAPGFGWTPLLLEILEARQYAYDASTLPSILSPLARRYFLATAKLSPEELSKRSALFGSFRDGLRPVTPYLWRVGRGEGLLEIPVTTLPIARVPFHMSYLLYLAGFSKPLMFAYLRTAIAVCKATGVSPSFLLHPPDVLGRDEAPELAFFPGMRLPYQEKLGLVIETLRILGKSFRLVPMGTHAQALLQENGAPRGRAALPAYALP
jgi:hypothetical protein